MARITRSAQLEKRQSRTRLKTGKNHWRAIHEGLALGYWKGKKTSSWLVRVRKDDGGYVSKKFAVADDHQDADGRDVLNYTQAHKRAQMLEPQLRYPDVAPTEQADPLVSDLLDEYLTKHKLESASWQSTEYAIEKMKVAFAGKRVSELTTAMLRRWHQAQAKPRSDSAESKRKARATANRKLTVLKAALNWGWSGPSAVADSWRAVKPFPKVDAPPAAHLSLEEVTRLLNACEPDFRELVEGTLLVGGRYGEMSALTAGNFNQEAGSILLPTGKTGFREVWLSAEGVAFFQRITAGKKRGERIFTHSDGSEWRQAHQIRRMRESCERSSIEPAVPFKALRTTYGALLAMQGTSPQVIQRQLGHADLRMTLKHYAHLLPNYVADEIRAKLPSFGVYADSKVTSIKVA